MRGHLFSKRRAIARDGEREEKKKHDMLSVMSHEKLSLRECVRTEEETWRESQTLLEKIVLIKERRSTRKAYLRFLISCFISRFRAVK